MFGNKGTLLVVQTAALVLVARELGTSGRGALAVGVNLTLVLVQVGTFGLVSANPYFVARQPELRSRIVANALFFAAIAGTLLVAAALGLKLAFPAAIAGLSWTMVARPPAPPPPLLAGGRGGVGRGAGPRRDDPADARDGLPPERPARRGADRRLQRRRGEPVDRRARRARRRVRVLFNGRRGRAHGLPGAGSAGSA